MWWGPWHMPDLEPVLCEADDALAVKVACACGTVFWMRRDALTGRLAKSCPFCFSLRKKAA